MTHQKPSVLCRLLPLALLLPACGDGGGGTSAPPPARTPESVIFVAEDGVRLLASNDDGTGTPIELTGGAGLAITEFALSPARDAVAYVLNPGAGASDRLFVRELAQGAALEVMTTDNDFAEVTDLRWSPDGQSIAYRADDMIDDRPELYRVPRAGGGSFRAYQSGQTTVFVAAEFSWSPNSRYIAFLLEQSGSPFELRVHDASSAVTGADVIEVVAPGRDIVDVRYSPDGEWLAFRSDGQASAGQFEVFRTLSDLTGTVIRSNGSVGSTVKIAEYHWSPSGDWLAQLVESHPGSTTVGVNTYQIASETSTRIITTPDIGTLSWSPVADKLAAAAAFVPGSGASSELNLLVYDAPSDMWEIVSDTLSGAEELDGELYAWALGGQRLAYIVNTAFSMDDLYLAVLGGASADVRVSGLSGNEIVALEWANGGGQLAALERNQTQAFHPGNWYLVSSGGQVSWTSAEILTFLAGFNVRWSADAERAVFGNASAGSGDYQLYSGAANTSGTTDLSAENANIGFLFELALGQ